MTTNALLSALPLAPLGFGAAQNWQPVPGNFRVHSAGGLADAWDCGVRYFDTAPHYGLGLSERRVGSFLSTKPRNEYVLSTKVGRLLQESPHTAHLTDDEGFDVPAACQRVRDFSYDGIVMAGVYNSGILARDKVSSTATYNYENAPQELISKAQDIAAVCERYSVTLPQAALAFASHAPQVISTVVGMRTGDHVHQTVARMSAQIPSEMWTELEHRGLLPQHVAS